jgi:nucleoside 2-deoxyribosyltransferase
MLGGLVRRLSGGGRFSAVEEIGPKPPAVYISYSRPDLEFVHNLTQELSNAGFGVVLDSTLPPGQEFLEAIAQAIGSSDIGVAIWSKTSVLSGWVIAETREFIALGKPVLHLKIDDCEIPDGFAFAPIIEFSGDVGPIVAAALDLLGIDALGDPTPVPARLNKGVAFLSYCEEDQYFIFQLVAFMKDRMYNWWGYEEEGREFNVTMFRELEDRIASSDIVLSVLSPGWRESDWSVKEYYYAKALGKPTFLLMAVDPGPTLAIAGEPYIDFVKSQHQGFVRLDREMKRLGL